MYNYLRTQTKGDSAMKKWFKALWKAIEESQQKRADYKLLQMLSDRELRDLGIGRSQIQEIIYGENSNGKAA
jgi:uncharacterized protein YjiS (DUF1127 family)